MARVRKVGSSYDVPGWPRGERVRNNEGPPREKPGPVPADRVDPFAPKAFEFQVTDATLDDADKIFPRQVNGPWKYKPSAAAAAGASDKQAALKGAMATSTTAEPISVTGTFAQRTYKTMGGRMCTRGRQTVTVTEKITRLTVESDGKPVCETSTSTSASPIVNRQEG